jgi:nucleoid-associated protein YgaU
MAICHRGMQMTDIELLGRLLEGACEVDEQLLAALLDEGVPPAAALRRATRGWWHGGAALLLGGALALSSVGGATAREAATGAVAAPVGGSLAHVAGGVALGARAAAPTARAAEAPSGLAGAALMPGTILLIPPLEIQAQQGTTPSGQLQSYQVQPGDSLWAIAQRLYGNGGHWERIYNANQSQIANANLIFPGQVLSIPASGGPSLTPGTTPPGNQTGGGPGQYTVQPGDSLWAIAQWAYGDGTRWQEIYNANTAKIGPNPGMIFAGTELSIPR